MNLEKSIPIKNVWLLNHYALEPGGAGGTRHYHLATHLKELGWCVHIIAASVELNSGRQRLSDHEKQRHEVAGGVPFLWLRTPTYLGNGSGRVINMLVYAVRAFIPRSTGKLPRPDVVIGSSVHPFAALSACLLAWRHRVPFVFEVRDLWPQTLIDMGRLKQDAPVAVALRLLEKWLYKRAARIVVLLPFAGKYIESLGIPKERVSWISNGVDLDLFPPNPRIAQVTPGIFTLMYFGAHGQANGLDVILKAMKRLQDRPGTERIRLRMIGDGPQKKALIAYALELGLRNVCFEDSVTKSKIPEIASGADAFVLSVLNLPELYRYGISMNKVFEYMAAGRPTVIASSAANNPIVESGGGFSVPAGDAEGMADAIVSLSALTTVERDRMGQAAREHIVKEYSYGFLASKMAGVLDDVVAGSARARKDVT